METGRNKRVILIKGDNSKWYEQAIFIVKKNIPSSKVPVDFVSEAEDIINRYINGGSVALDDTYNKAIVEYAVSSEGASPSCKTNVVPLKKKRLGFDFALNLIMLLSFVVMACIVSVIVFK